MARNCEKKVGALLLLVIRPSMVVQTRAMVPGKNPNQLIQLNNRQVIA